MPDRKQEADYRYGYQGEYSEKEELGGTHSFELRMYDSRIGRWQTPDPAREFHSPYLAMGNIPHMAVDAKGDTIRISFRDGFLGIFGNKQNLRYDENLGNYVNQDGSIYEGKLPNFYKNRLDDLNTLNEDPDGFGLIGFLSSHKNDIFIGRGSNTTKNKKGLPNTAFVGVSGGNEILKNLGINGQDLNTPSWIVLGHELSHATDIVTNSGGEFSTWYGTNTNSEKTAVYMENKFRTNSNHQLRRYYSDGGPAVIDAQGNALFPGKKNRADRIIQAGTRTRLKNILPTILFIPFN